MTIHQSDGEETADVGRPLTPSEADISDFPRMPMDVGRLFASNFHARSDDSTWRAGVTLWLKAFHQVPAGSLPDDDVSLCRLAELGRDVAAWRAMREGALYGWELCSDGRRYHRVVAELALEAWIEKLAYRIRGTMGNAKRWGSHGDIERLGQQFVDARKLLRAIAPLSKTLTKKYGITIAADTPGEPPPGAARPRGPRKAAGARQQSIAEGSQQGSQEGSQSHGAAERVPIAQGSQEGSQQGSQVKQRDISPISPLRAVVDKSPSDQPVHVPTPAAADAVRHMQALRSVLKVAG